jgi:uncharacterized repeat protein (TIGR03803 family)
MKINYKFACSLILFSAVAFSRLQAQTENVLYNFPASGSDGWTPAVALVAGGDGNFYGMTSAGGANSLGTIYKITPAGALTTLVSFTGTSGAFLGSAPHGSLLLGGDGNFYGTTANGGISNIGTIFQITPSGAFTTLFQFPNVASGQLPYAGLVQDAGGNFYGSTQYGGAHNYGTIFKLSLSGGVWTLTTLVSFDGVNNGRQPFGSLVQGSDGNFYGTTVVGLIGNTYGTVFKMTPAGALTTLFTFNGTDGEYPHGGLVQGSDGNFYGTTGVTSTTANGTIFVMTPAGGLTTLVSFTGPNGSAPRANFVQGSDGNFYGATGQGGSNSLGTLFAMTPAGALTTLVNSSSASGSGPYGGLVQGSDGNFYGVSQAGGTSNTGVFFQLVPPQPVPALPRWGEVALALGVFMVYAAFLKRGGKLKCD